MTALLLLAALGASTLEQPSTSLVRDRFERAGRTLPSEDARLVTAARALAALALEKSASDAAGLLAVTEAVSVAGGWDASPTAVLIKGTRAQVLQELEKQSGLADEPASAFGVGAAERGERAAVCVLLAQRKFELAPLQRRYLKPPRSVSVCGQLTPPLETAELFVTQPSGAVVRQPMKLAKVGLCATFQPAPEGRSVVEVLGRGPRGPEVAALFFLDVGVTRADTDQQVIEPTSLAESRKAILSRINGLRRTMGVSAVVPDAALDAIAQGYAERMAAEEFFAHVDPSGGDLKSRLHAAQYRFTAAGENLGASTGPLAAHFGIEHSPGHRLNLLEPGHRALGVGVTRRASDGLAVVVEILAAPLDDGGADPMAAAYQTIDELRARKGLPALKRHAVLEALAQEHARTCLGRDQLSSELAGGRKLHDRVFEAMTDAREASVDLAILESPTLVPASKNLGSARYTTVGVGLVRGDSARYGKDKLWLVVLYASQAD